MTPRRAITPLDCRAALRAVKPLRFAPTPFGAGGLDGPYGPPRIGNYVMAGIYPSAETYDRFGKEKTMHASRITPSIEVTIGRETRLYHAFITTAPARLDAPATLTLQTGPFSDVSAMAADPITLDPTRAKSPARLVLVDAIELNGNAPATARSNTSSRQLIRCSLARTRCSTGCGSGSVLPRRISSS